MLGRQERDQLEFCVCGSLRDLVPDDHVLARVDRVLDLGWLHEEVADLHAAGIGRPGIDSEAAARLMLAGFLLGIVHDRRLMREAQVNLAICWFAGFGLHDRLPDHSSLTRIRQRWGAERFRAVFERTVKACVAARDRQRRGCPCGRLLDPRRRRLGEPGGAARRGRREGQWRGRPRSRRRATDPRHEEDRTLQEGLPHRPRRHHGDHWAQPPARAQLQAARGGRRRVRRGARRRGHHRRGERGRPPSGPPRCGRRNHRGRDRDGHGRRRLRLRLRQGLRRSRAEGDHSRHPRQDRADPQPRSDATVLLRREARHAEVPEGEEAEAGPPREARAVLHVPGSGLPRLRPRAPLPLGGPDQQGPA